MKKLLVINASARREHSHSRALTEAFISGCNVRCPGAIIRHRELGDTQVPHVNEAWIVANVTPAANRTALEMEVLKISDAYTTYLQTAFHMAGIEDIQLVAVSGTSGDKAALKNTVMQARQQIQIILEAIK